jgi:DNA-binding XRE family transcriptional regulator
MGSDVVLIDSNVLELLKLNNGIFALGFVRDGYPVCYPRFAVEVEENSITFIESDVKVIESLKISNKIAISLFDWEGNTVKSFQLKGWAEVFEKETPYFDEIVKKFELRTMKPSFLNEIANRMNERMIIPKKEFVVKLDFNIKYSQAPSPQSAKPLIAI